MEADVIHISRSNQKVRIKCSKLPLEKIASALELLVNEY
jgi:hypothetical protein